MACPGRHHFREIFYKALRKVNEISIDSPVFSYGTLLLYLSTVFVAMASCPLDPPPVMIKVSASSIPHPRLKVKISYKIYCKNAVYSMNLLRLKTFRC